MRSINTYPAWMRILFDINNWFIRYYSKSGLIHYLFFVCWLSEQILKISRDLISIDCISKTNHYCISLYLTSRIISWNISFLLDLHLFLLKYIWITIKFYFFFDNSIMKIDLIFIKTNCKKGLIKALNIVFLQIKIYMPLACR